ncbi:transglutaminase TgpA family protein [Haloarcula brevis]|uniref:transglutaminase TgpA family protein n=1 Tax=Haloarcula brevis TaxID=3111453 RepID=UPI00300F5CDA
MGSDDSPFDDVSADRDYLRVLLTAVCVVAVVLATATLPILSPGGTETPMESLVPLPQESPFGSAGGASTGGGGGQLGALNPGSQTSVGGSLGGGDSPYRSQDTEPHFTVTSSEPAYWRTGAYETYTGTGWDGRADPRAYEGPLAVDGMADTTVDYEVQLARSATSLPTVWRPKSVSRDDVLVTAYGAVTSERPLPAGTTYSATSVTPPDDPDVLRTSGRDYPDAVESRYTGVPASTSAQVGPFTDRLTEDSDSPYETAATIERWLEANKNYSLNVSQQPEDDVASEFIFQMDRGYCEYFATSMVVMLRSQDIPARYVVGYSTGERTGQNRYTVRGMNAHAWVEVYFEGVGWVRFDPTPGRERLESERQAMEDSSQEYSAAESGSPGEEFAVGTPTETPTDGTGQEPGGSGDEDTETGADGADDGTDGSGDDQSASRSGEFVVELNRTATPGAAVAATVTRDGAPVEGAAVAFNGEPVGTTGPDGTVSGTVPYEAELTITVDAPGDAAALVAPSVPRDGTRAFAVAGPRAQQSTNTSYELNTTASVTVTGDAVTGGEVVVTATVDGVPVRDGGLWLDGERVATTNRRGRATVTLPTEPGNVTVAVERDAVSGNTTVVLERLAVATSPTLPLALPATGQRVNATMDGEPVSNATVEVDGEPAARTGATGRTTVGMPFAASTTVTVSKYGQTATATVGGLFVNAAGVLAVSGTLLAGAVVGARRRQVTPGTLRAWVRAARELAVGALVGLAAAVDGLLGGLRTRARLTAAALRDLFAGRRSPSALLEAARAWVDARLSAAEAAASGALGTDAEEADGAPAARVTIREAWTRLLAQVSLRRYWTRTPGDIAAHAIERDGLPPAAVRTVRDAFRAVEYGQRDPQEHVAAVEDAIRAIESAAGTQDATDDDAEGRS